MEEDGTHVKNWQLSQLTGLSRNLTQKIQDRRTKFQMPQVQKQPLAILDWTSKQQIILLHNVNDVLEPTCNYIKFIAHLQMNLILLTKLKEEFKLF